MSNKLAGPKIDDKVTKTSKSLGYPVFCFKHLTTNKKYNIKYFQNFREKERAYAALFYIIDYMQKLTWQELFLKDKFSGFETIANAQIKFIPDNYNLTPDTKILVIRFKRGQYRMLGLKSDKHDDVFHIIGFDFNHKAYKH